MRSTSTATVFSSTRPPRSRKARRFLKDIRPLAVILDILLPGGQDSWGFLAEIKTDPATRDIPVLVATILDNQQKGLALARTTTASSRWSANGSWPS